MVKDREQVGSGRASHAAAPAAGSSVGSPAPEVSCIGVSKVGTPPVTSPTSTTRTAVVGHVAVSVGAR